LTVPTGENPDSILYDSATHNVFAFDNRGKDVTAFKGFTEGASKDVVRIELGGQPEEGAADGKGNVYVNLEDTSEIVKIDAKTMKVVARWPLAPGEGPTGLGYDPKTNHLFSCCHNKMMVLLDAANGKVLGTAPIGDGTDGGGFDPKTGCAFSSNREGTLTVLREEKPGKLAVVQTVKTAVGARTMTVDQATGRIYLPTAKFGPAPTTTSAAAPASGAKGPAGGKARNRPSAVPGSFMIVVVGR
jgi:DNA-binding beta-propeller fold protein YncE